MSSPQAFIDRALSAGYTKDEISRFLQQAGTLKGKEKQAMEILRRSPSTMDFESQRIAGEAIRDPAGSGIGSALGTAAKVGVPLALGFAAGGPLISAAAEAIGAAGAAGLGAEAAGLGAAESGLGGLGGLGSVFSRPTGKEAVALANTFRKRGLGQTLAQFGSQQAKRFADREGGASATQAQQSSQLPEPIAQLAVETFQKLQDPVQTGNTVGFQVMEQGHPLRNLARTFQQRAGVNIEDAIAQFLSGAAEQGAENPTSSLSEVSDSDLLALAKRMGIL